MNESRRNHLLRLLEDFHADNIKNLLCAITS